MIGSMLAVSCKDSSLFSLSGADIIFSSNDFNTAQKAAALLRSDIESVTGVRTGEGKGKVIIGTVGKSELLDSLASAGLMDFSEIEGQWERFIIQQVDPSTLVIAGSDRRGTAYGAFHVSEAIGVNPFVWWADVPVKRNSKAFICGERFVSKTPSVKYRGFFINDEDWGLKTWSQYNYETDLGDIGPKTYARICELILRLGGNMLGPAMHTCTGAFYTHPESKVVADEYGIVITTSHCEPMLFNNADRSEWNRDRDGEWNYRTNKETIWNKFNDRVAEACIYENMYTTAMRGVHDSGLAGNFTTEEKVAVLTDVINDQRDILVSHLGRPADEIPQIFVPYKECLDVYEAGLQVPDDITLVWPDDNYGYMKRVSNPEEQKRSGHSGVYYHTSYLGSPHDYLWINTTPPVLMYEELKKAYDAGADKYWLLNVGDIKPAELAIRTFFEMAKDIDAFDIHSVNEYQAGFLAGIFGKKYQKEFQSILDEYYRLAWIRKPEAMGWEREWDRKELADLMDTEFSFENYNDAKQRLADYKALSDRAETLKKKIPEEYRPAYFELLEIQCKGSYQMNRKFLLSQLNHEKFAAGEYAQANWAAFEAQASFDSIAALIDIYNKQLDGKWDHMMALAPAFNSKSHLLPELNITDGVKAEEPGIEPEPFELERCAVLSLKGRDGLVRGMGFDGGVLPIDDLKFDLPDIDADSVTVHIWTVPFWPKYAGSSNRYSVSLDNGDERVVENVFVENSDSWKDQVLCNGKEAVLTFALKPESKKHVLSLKAVDEGQMVQRIILDWGGLKSTYVGPQADRL